MSTSHPIIQVVEVVAFPRLKFLLKLLIGRCLVLVCEVDGIDQEWIISMLWSDDFLTSSSFFW